LSSSNLDERPEHNQNGAGKSSAEPRRKYKHSKSVQLNKFEFPIKSLILLGNEKEGIPVDLIQMLDTSRAIPTR
jgi:hypothetical protein